MSTRLDRDFFIREDVVHIARELLGKVLVTEFKGIRTSGKIVETEAYRGPEDRACHAFDNKRTARTAPIFDHGGIAYVYLIYGLHHLFNVVTGKRDQPHAVLVRAIEPLENVEEMLLRRNLSAIEYRLSSGPGTLSAALGITRDLTGMDLTAPRTSISIEDHGLAPDGEIISSPRVGVAYAKECAHWPWRFRDSMNPWTSKPKEVNYD